ncbi:MAG: hypothetical protein LBQ49_02120, partial [Rickettsiales bacterium]|nr:hypothetical protein [Rickettsiales bacterium]
IVDSTNNQTCDADSNGAPWVFNYSNGDVYYCRRSCANICALYCIRLGSGNLCSRSALLNIPACEWLGSAPTASSVTCPLSGTCENPDYKTVVDNAPCGTGYVETTTPALTISGEYGDSKGTFTYGNCTAN